MLTKNKKAPSQRIIAFGVEKIGNEYVPTRFEIEGGEVTKQVQCAPRGPYKPQAYQYIAARVMEFYTQSSTERP
jgi:hypothetical protein